MPDKAKPRPGRQDNWLSRQMASAETEVSAWPQWKREAMLAEAGEQASAQPFAPNQHDDLAVLPDNQPQRPPNGIRIGAAVNVTVEGVTYVAGPAPDPYAECRRQRDSRPLWARGWSAACRWAGEARYRAGRAWDAVCGRGG